MRTTKRFTPAVLERFSRNGRGIGTNDDYVPWHCVSRSDPASRGRSHLQQLFERQYNLLSDQEWVGLFFASMLPNLHDIREQFPLELAAGRHELSAYRIDAPTGLFPGTVELAPGLGIKKYPSVAEQGVRVPWRLTTDLLLTLSGRNGQLEFLAVSIKPNLAITKRQKQLLGLEKAYWNARSVEWLLVTSAEYEESVGLTLRQSMPHVVGPTSPQSHLAVAADVAHRHCGRSLTFLLNEMVPHVGGMNNAQRAFWQAAWAGMFPLDFRRDWRPHQPVVLLNEGDFVSQNPIASRRSAWI
ncbi:MAG: transposase [Betaproteobacteria bacterium HGW-Betaproteobacteria-5]|nr:MAG: transposase [Betaproteobacteria bacterium HGW-Betaproteobacteria-5]PKO38582.1 MAG: transposase [Betaproteobacteria bacterium HGW-Betaproteobacteria-6]